MKDAVEIIAEQFRRLPGIGIKSARRLAYFMLERPQEDVDTFLNTIKRRGLTAAIVPSAVIFLPVIPAPSAVMTAEISILSV